MGNADIFMDFSILNQWLEAVRDQVFTFRDQAEQQLAQLNTWLQDNPEAQYAKAQYHLLSAMLENQRYNNASVLPHLKKAFTGFAKWGDAQWIAETQVELAVNALNTGDQESAEKYLREVLDFPNLHAHPSLLSRFLLCQAHVSLMVFDYPSATEYCIKAEQVLLGKKVMHAQDQFVLTLVHSILGLIYDKTEKPEAMKEAYLKVVNISERNHIHARLSWHYYNLGNCYKKLGDKESALTYYQKAIQIEDDINRKPRALAYGDSGFLALDEGQLELALDYFSRCAKVLNASQRDDQSYLSGVHEGIAMVYLQQGQHLKAEEALKTALDLSVASEDDGQKSKIYFTLSTYFESKSDFEQAYRYLSKHKEAAASYQQMIKENKLYELQVRYEADAKKREAELLRLQSVQLQLKALRAQMNPHFMFNALNGIQQAISAHRMDDALSYLSRFAKLMRKSLDYSDLEQVTLEEELAFLKEYLDLNKVLRFNNSFTFEVFIDEDVEEDLICVPTMILQPYVENALEHGIRGLPNGRIELHFNMEGDDRMRIHILDNGIGLTKAKERKMKMADLQIHQSKGTSITEERLNLLSKTEQPAKVQIVERLDPVSNAVQGTSVWIELPVEILRKGNRGMAVS